MFARTKNETTRRLVIGDQDQLEFQALNRVRSDLNISSRVGYAFETIRNVLDAVGTGDGGRVVETPSRKAAVRRGDEISSESKRDSQPRATRAKNFVLLSRNERPARGSYVCRENLLVERSRASPQNSVARNRHCARCPRFIETILPLLFHPHLHFHPLLP